MCSSCSSIWGHFSSTRKIDWTRSWWEFFFRSVYRIFINLSRFESLENHESVDKFSIEQNEGIYKRLSEVIHSHNEVIQMCNTLSKTLWQNFLLHFVLSSLVMCITCLMVLQSDNIENSILFTCYTCAYISQTFVFCACGNMLIIAGQKVNTVAYNIQWYKCNAKVRRAVLMIMIRAQRDINVKVPFFELSLETFAWVSFTKKYKVHASWEFYWI